MFFPTAYITRNALALLVLVLIAGPAQATMSSAERDGLDLREYVVTDREASYFDVEARRAFLQETDDLVLRGVADRLSLETACRDKMALPVVDFRIELPSFYAQQVRWRRLVQPIFAFEAAVSELAAAHLSSSDSYHAECLVEFLSRWASRNAFEDYDYRSNDRQAWYQVEAAIFASAMAYSIVRPSIVGHEAELARINAWMLRLARRHSSFEGVYPSCCNNHLYRRATYAAMVGVLTGDNRLFQFGVSGIYSALSDATGDGALPHEMERGRLATHYQNFALIYLVMTAQIIEQQGYSIFDRPYRGSTLHELIDFNISIIEDPMNLGDHAPGDVQSRSWMEDDQYFAWAEIYLAHRANARLTNIVEPRRPLYNRSSGGYLSLFFYDPSRPVWGNESSFPSPELRPMN